MNFFIWLKELNFFFNFDTKNCSFLFLDSNNEILSVWHAELNLFFNTTHRIEHFFDYDSQKLTIFSWNMTKELDSYFLNMTQRIEPFISWIWRKELNPLFLEYDAKNWTLFSNMTQRIGSFFQIWLKEMNFFQKTNDTNNWTFFWVLEWNSFLPYESKNWNFFNMTHRIEIFCFWIWLTELNLFSQWLKEFNSFFLGYDSRIELFFWYGLKELNSFLKKKKTMTQRIEPIFNTTRSIIDLYEQKLWLKEFNLFVFFQKKNITQRIEPFFFEHDSRNCSFFGYDWKIFQNMTLRTEPFFFSNVTQKLNCFFNSKNWTFLLNVTQIIEPFFLQFDSNKWTYFEI